MAPNRDRNAFDRTVIFYTDILSMVAHGHKTARRKRARMNRKRATADRGERKETTVERPTEADLFGKITDDISRLYGHRIPPAEASGAASNLVRFCKILLEAHARIGDNGSHA